MTLTYQHRYTTPGVYTITVTDATGASRTQDITVTGAQLPTPAGFAVTAEGPTTAGAVWGSVPNATGYRVEWRLQGDTGAWTGADVAAPATTYDITGLAPDSGYDVRVKAVAAGGTYPDSAWATATVTTLPTPTLPAPGGLAVAPTTGSESTSLTATWTAPGTGVPTGYEVRWAPTGTTTWTVLPSTTSLTADITGLTADTGYDVQVRALGDGTLWATSDWSATVTGTTAAA